MYDSFENDISKINWKEPKKGVVVITCAPDSYSNVEDGFILSTAD